MIFVKHHSSPPRTLENRQKQDTPQNPSKSWSNFNGRKELRSHLMSIQKGLCAYCEIRLENELGYHIEHIESKSLNPQLTFKYTNLILSCIKDGAISDNTDSNPVSCGHATLKNRNEYDTELFIKPTELDCESYFSYDLFGNIIPNANLTQAQKQRTEHTIEVLNLNCKRLKRERAAILEEGYQIIRELEDDVEALNNFLDLELSLINDKYFSFINLRREHFSEYICND